MTLKAFAVLRHLVAHAGRLVTKEELLSAVWGETVVSEATLTSAIRDLRRTLHDAAAAPRYIETVHRWGFRFIGPVVPASQSVVSSQDPVASRKPALQWRETLLFALRLRCAEPVLSSSKG